MLTNTTAVFTSLGAAAAGALRPRQAGQELWETPRGDWANWDGTRRDGTRRDGGF